VLPEPAPAGRAVRRRDGAVRRQTWLGRPVVLLRRHLQGAGAQRHWHRYLPVGVEKHVHVHVQVHVQVQVRAWYFFVGPAIRAAGRC